MFTIILMGVLYLPIKIDVEDIKKGEIRLETLDGKLITKKRFSIKDNLLETYLKIKEKIRDPFMYRIVVKDKKRKLIKSLAQVSPFPVVGIDLPEKIEQEIEIPLRIFLTPISLPLTEPYTYTLTLKDKEGNLLYEKKGNIETEKYITIKVPPQKNRIKLTLLVENSYSTLQMEETREVIPRKIKTFLVTDKPLYQPSQTVHIRTLSLYSFDKKPVSNKKLIFKIIDPSSNVVFKKTVRTDEFGVAYANFLIADQVKTGSYKIEISDESQKLAEKNIQIKKYVLPKFLITLKTDKDIYTPGDTLKGEIKVSYFFKKPVTDGKVRIILKKYEIGFEEIKKVSGYTDKNGVFTFKFILPDYFAGLPLEKGGTVVFLDVLVEDKTGHREEKTFERRIIKKPVNIYLVPLGGKLIEGIKNKILIFAFHASGKPLQGRITIRNKNFFEKIKTDSTGFAYFYYTPSEDKTVFDVYFESKNLPPVSERFELTTQQRKGSYLFVVPNSLIQKAGERFKATIYASLDIKRVYVDLLKENSVYLKKTVVLENGKGDFKMDIDPMLAGSVILSVYAITSEQNIIRDRKILYFAPADELIIKIEKEKSYLPGGEARIKFKVTDRNGNGVISALCVSIVDEAVFALTEMHPGLEKLFFEIEKEILKPRYEIHELKWKDVVRGRRKPAIEMLLSVASSKLEEKYIPVFLSLNYNELKNRLKKHFDPLLEKLSKKMKKHYDEIIEYENKFLNSYLINQGLLKPQELLDPWGTECKICKRDYEFYLHSAGPDKKFDTEDDLVYRIVIKWKRERVFPALFAAAPEGEIAGLKALKVDRAPSLKEKKKVHIRKYFPETFLFEPSLITDKNGEAYIDVTIPDAITTYRMIIFASSEDGLLGSTEDEIKIFKELFVEPDIPLNLVRGDEISLRIGVYNYSPYKRTVKIKVSTNENIELLETKKVITIKGNDVGKVYIRLKAKKAGKGVIRIEANSNNTVDIVEREIEIVPPGIKQEISTNGTLSKEKKFIASYPHEAGDEGKKSFVRIYPGALSQVLSGLEQLLRVPFGCFEQTSSVTYPNILILDYMRTKGIDNPEIDMKATEYIGLGYQRLLSFEVETGGFSWFGNPPANKILTAYGLREFNDMKKVYDIDERVIERTLKWLLSQQRKDGSFAPDEFNINEEVTVGIQKGILPTAYIAWTLSEIGYKGKEVEKARKFIKKHLNELKDSYELAIALNAFVEDEKTFEQIWKKLAKRMIERDDMVYWESQTPSLWRIGGKGKTIETTALIGNALLRSQKKKDIIKKIINFLYHTRSSRGDWYTTQATILALKDIIMNAKTEEEIEGILYVEKDGRETQRIKIDKDNQNLVIVEFKNEAKIRFEGKGTPVYDFVRSFYTERPPLPQRKILDIKINFDKKELKVNDLVKVTVEIKALKGVEAGMVIVDLGIPPGFSVLTPEWEEMVSKKIIERYELTPRQIIVYLEKITSTPVVLEYHLRADFPLKVKGTFSKAYEYYDPENTVYTESTPLKVK